MKRNGLESRRDVRVRARRRLTRARSAASTRVCARDTNLANAAINNDDR
jgi:hypothetical protein